MSFPVIIRMETYKNQKNAIAFFPNAKTNSPYDIVCYARVGQHSEATIDYYSKTTRPRLADKSECDALLSELRAIYETNDKDHMTLKVMQRLSRKSRQNKKQ